jgi:hypothetical protein
MTPARIDTVAPTSHRPKARTAAALTVTLGVWKRPAKYHGELPAALMLKLPTGFAPTPVAMRARELAVAPELKSPVEDCAAEPAMTPDPALSWFHPAGGPMSWVKSSKMTTGSVSAGTSTLARAR